MLIEDLFGRLRLVVWTRRQDWEELRHSLSAQLGDPGVAGRFWSGDIWNGSAASEADRLLYEKAWEESEEVEGAPRLHEADRYRNRSAWFALVADSLWPTFADEENGGPPLLVFYSFKGGAGRSTAVASFAIQRARKGERIVVIDFDLDAPGVGSLLAADEAGTTASWGVVDYLLERPGGEVDLPDYYHACRREAVTGRGEIIVVPAGRLDSEYLGKLARVDLEPPGRGGEPHPLILLLTELRHTLQPAWILIDARTGLSEPAGLLLGGLAHLHVLFGTASEQSWQGLRLVLSRLGASRVRMGRPQAECLLVHAMVPRNVTISAMARAAFSDRARVEFTDAYYAEDPEDPEDDRFWYVRDAENEDAPHVPVALSYDEKLAHFGRVDEVASDLAESPEYSALADRIAARFQPESEE
ncbi:MAG: hypothetical protein HY726_16830 [Candidatus Rokubacteria bacterium]|nr:hypothetical protein [Candidatus Rokubacteria bacterium]